MINGTLMSGNIEVIEFKDEHEKILNEKLAPLYFLNGGNIETWLEKRAIDEHRTNSRILKKVLRLAEKDDISTVLAVNAVTITDNFWFKKENEKNITWKDVKFKDDLYYKTALTGDLNTVFVKPSRTPELTNIGSYEKCWKIENGHWYLYKSGNKQQYFSELFIYNLGKILGFNMAKYEYSDGYIKSLDFTNNNEFNFESMYSLTFDDDDYNVCFKKLKEIDPNNSKKILTDYLKMIYLDSVVLNVDRHTQNFGLLREKETGEIISLAPNFDNNIALISNNYPQTTDRKNDGLIKFLIDFLSENKDALNLFETLDLKDIDKTIIDETIEKLPKEIIDNINLEIVSTFVINGDKIIKKKIKELFEEEFL